MNITASTLCITARRNEGQQSSLDTNSPSARTWSLAAFLAPVKTPGASSISKQAFHLCSSFINAHEYGDDTL